MLLVVVAWVAAMVYSFWYFLLMDSRLFYANEQDRLVEFEKASLSNQLRAYVFEQQEGPLGKEHQGFIFHFWNPACSCDKANMAHVKKLMRLYGQQGFVFYIVPHLSDNLVANGSAHKAVWLELLNEYPEHIKWVDKHSIKTLPIPASPSAAVLNGQGKLSYFGPYALGGVCKADENGLIETVLNSMVAGLKPDHPFVGGFGCFCQWNTSSNTR